MSHELVHRHMHNNPTVDSTSAFRFTCVTISNPTPYNYKFVHNSCLSADRQVDPLTRSTIQVFVDSFARVVSRALENATTRASSFPLNFSRAKESTKLGEGSTCVLV